MYWMFEEEYPDDVDELLGAPLHHPHENTNRQRELVVAPSAQRKAYRKRRFNPFR